jgi:hypothetical protein
MASEVRSRKRSNKKNSPVGNKSASAAESSATPSPKLQSLSVQLASLRERVSDDSALFLKYEQVLKSEISRRSPPPVKCSLFSLCKKVIKVLWVVFLVVVLVGAAVGAVIYKVDSLRDAFSIYVQEHLYELLRYTRFAIIALYPVFPRLIKPCIVPNPFSPAYKCACMEGMSIENRSLELGIPKEDVIITMNMGGMGELPTVDLYALRKLYYLDKSLQEPCAEFGAEPMEGQEGTDEQLKYEVSFAQLFKSKDRIVKQMASTNPWKAIWQECGPPSDKRSVMSLVPKLKLPPGYEFVTNPVVFASGQWGRYYHMPELWSKEPVWVVMVVLHGGLRITIDGSTDCMEYCMDHKNMVLKPGDAGVCALVELMSSNADSPSNTA